MSRDPTDLVVAHADLLRAVIHLLREADHVRQKLQRLGQLPQGAPVDGHGHAAVAASREGRDG